MGWKCWAQQFIMVLYSNREGKKPWTIKNEQFIAALLQRWRYLSSSTRYWCSVRPLLLPTHPWWSPCFSDREDPYAAETTTNETANATITFEEARRGVCFNVTSGIHLEIMYAETGQSNRFPLLEVIGASIRYVPLLSVLVVSFLSWGLSQKVLCQCSDFVYR